MKKLYLTSIVLVIIGIGILFIIWNVAGPSTVANSSSSLPSKDRPAQVHSGAISDTQVYRNDHYGFALTMPARFTIETHSSNILYETQFTFKTGTSTVPLVLRVTNLDIYLPLTNTPTLPEYVETFRNLEQFRKVTIGGKDAYEYLICGSAACSQQVVFIHDAKQYEFTIQFEAYFPNEHISGEVNPKSIDFESAPHYIQQIIGSLRFLHAG